MKFLVVYEHRVKPKPIEWN